MGAAAAAAQLDLTVGLAGAPGARTVCGAAPHRRRLPGAPGNTALPPGRAGGGAARGHLRPWRAGRSPGSARRPWPCGAPRGAALHRALGRARRWPRQALVWLCAGVGVRALVAAQGKRRKGSVALLSFKNEPVRDGWLTSSKQIFCHTQGWVLLSHFCTASLYVFIFNQFFSVSC